MIPSSVPAPRRWLGTRRRPAQPGRQYVARRLELEQLEERTVLDVGWTQLTNAAPAGTGTMMLLTDGTVLVQGPDGGATNTWYRLTPDSTGSYINGTWSALASMSTPRLYFASNVLPSGKVFVLGGEYTDQGQVFTNTGEIYDPVANSWRAIANFPNSQFGDDPSALLPDGTLLTGYISGPQTYIYNPTTNVWSQTGSKLNNDQSDEESWVNLPDGSVLSYDVFNSAGKRTGTAERYVPSTGTPPDTWVATGSVPLPLTSARVGFELGPALLLPSNGKVLVLGANGRTALYTPSTNSWASGPVIPNRNGADDAPGAVLPNGDVLFAADRPLFHGPTKIYDYNPTANTISAVTTPTALTNQLNQAAFVDRMVVLPTGQVLFTTGSSTLWIYTPSGSANSAWLPVVNSVTNNGDGTYTLSGTQLNGLDEGAAYGDDAEMSSNYPIVQLQDTSGHVFYARTTNWSLPGAVATGSTVETVVFTPPAGLAAGAYNLFSIANGISSAAFSFTIGGPSGSASRAAASSLAPSVGHIQSLAFFAPSALSTTAGDSFAAGQSSGSLGFLFASVGRSPASPVLSSATLSTARGSVAASSSGLVTMFSGSHSANMLDGGAAEEDVTTAEAVDAVFATAWL